MMQTKLEITKLAGEAGWVIVGQVVTAVMSLLGTRLMTEVVLPEVYGEVALFTALVNLGYSLCGSPIVMAVGRFYNEARVEDRLSDLRVALTRLALPWLALTILVFLAVGAVFGTHTDADPWTFAAAVLLLTATVRGEFEIHWLVAARRNKAASLWQIADTIARPVMTVAIVVIAGSSTAVVLFGYLGATCLVILISLLVVKREGLQRASDKHDSLTMRERLSDFIWPLVPVQALKSLNATGDRFIIAALLSTAHLGLYVATYVLVSQAFLRLAMILQRFFQPIYFQAHAHGRTQQVNKVYTLWAVSVVALGAVGVLLLILSKDWVAHIFLAATYSGAAKLMPWIGIGSALCCLSIVFQQPLLVAQRTRLLIIPPLAGVVAGCVSIPLLAERWGILGAAMACPVYYGVEALCMAVIAKPWKPICKGRQTTPSVSTSMRDVPI
jgi:O-antigen/teichoic acid export membrane protein